MPLLHDPDDLELSGCGICQIFRHAVTHDTERYEYRGIMANGPFLLRSLHAIKHFANGIEMARASAQNIQGRLATLVGQRLHQRRITR